MYQLFILCTTRQRRAARAGHIFCRQGVFSNVRIFTGPRQPCCLTIQHALDLLPRLPAFEFQNFTCLSVGQNDWIWHALISPTSSISLRGERFSRSAKQLISAAPIVCLSCLGSDRSSRGSASANSISTLISGSHHLVPKNVAACALLIDAS